MGMFSFNGCDFLAAMMNAVIKLGSESRSDADKTVYVVH